ncbi:MAG: hypothetical protein QOE31_3303 [Solirubrobacteraceae bacterium]|nr:hypothetical protein [Solirubrobacteraceae bacterium]
MRLVRPALVVLAVACGAALVVAAAPAQLPTSAYAHPEPGDLDGDLVRNEQDNCPTTPNGRQLNTDGDAFGDACDTDDDNDGILDAAPDNCPLVPNPDQLDSDHDGRGDACPAADSDGDGVLDDVDNCAQVANADQRNLDADDQGDVCDRDDDNDDYDDGFDNCPVVYNFDQADLDGDKIGSACDADERIAGPAGGLSNPGGTGPATPAGPADSSAPNVTVTTDRNVHLKDAGRALVVRASCSEACDLSAVVSAGASAARHAGLGRTRIVLGRGSWSLAAGGRTYVFARWNGTARRLRAGRRLTSSLVLTATDTAGNRRTVTRRIDLRR